MKKHIQHTIFLMLFFFPITVIGQNDSLTTNKIYLRSNAASVGLKIQEGVDSPNLGFLRFGDNTGWKLHFGRRKESVSSSQNNGTNGVLMTIQDNGNVGIGTITPTDKLNILVGTTSSSAVTAIKIGGPENYPSLEFGIPEGGGYDGMIRTYGNDLRLYAGHWRTTGATATENHAIKFYTSKIGTSDWNTPKMVLNENGNLGLGIGSPQVKLHIDANYAGGATGINDWARLGRLVFSAPYNGYGEMGEGFYVEGSTFKHLYNDYASRISFWNGQIRFMTSTSGVGGNPVTWNSSFNIINNGNVGIGGVTPLTPLHVFGGSPMPSGGWSKTMTLQATYPVLTFNSNNQKWAGIGYDYTDGGLRFWVNRPNDDLNSGMAAFNIFNNGNIWASGNVGIGTTTPNAKLEVVKNLRISSNTSGFGYEFLRSDNDQKLDLQYMADNTKYSSIMTFTYTGQVAIGTTTPYSDYKLSVAGNVIADKVKVKKSTNGTWPDFVFSPSYKLPTLNEVETFVKQNSHLPEMPSAAEIEKDGQDLGEMNRLLLKKVEELTLYLIEEKKRNDNLQKRVEILEHTQIHK